MLKNKLLLDYLWKKLDKDHSEELENEEINKFFTEIFTLKPEYKKFEIQLRYMID